MTKDQLIAKQQLELEELRELLTENKKIKKDIIAKFYNIGAPLNDNILEFTRDQQRLCHQVVELTEQINSI